MTNNEILQSNLLDILFDGRNKEYGAYAIRRGYNHRMLMALGMGLSVFLLLFLLDTCQTGSRQMLFDISKGDLNLTAVQLLPDKNTELPKPNVGIQTCWANKNDPEYAAIDRTWWWY